MNVLDLFSGACGGWSLGLERAGMRTVAACESDPWRRARYSENFPGVKIYDDVQTLTAQRLRDDGIGPVHVVAGSPPCQDASTANHRGKGAGGARTGLVRHFIRLVREIRPDWTLIENVPGLRTRGVDWILASLAAAGYASWPLVVGADDAGAPHLRKRVWIIAYATEAYDGRCIAESNQRYEPEPGSRVVADDLFADADEDGIRIEPGRSSRPCGEDSLFASINVADSDQSDRRQREAPLGPTYEGRAELARIIGWRCRSWNGGLASFGELDDGLSKRLAKGEARRCIAAYGDAVVPQITEAIGRAVLKVSEIIK